MRRLSFQLPSKNYTITGPVLIRLKDLEASGERKNYFN